MHDSFTPLGGMIPLVNIMLGEVVFGGVGAGMYGMLIFVVIAVFIAGLMVGRTPEYLGKKIESYDVKMAMLYALIFPLIILTFAAIFVLIPQGLSVTNNPARMVSARFSTRLSPARATTARPSPAWVRTGGTTSRWAWTCSSADSS